MATGAQMQKPEEKNEQKHTGFEPQLLQTGRHADLAPLQTKEAEQLAPARPSIDNGIPAQMQQELERLSGFSFDDVQVHYNSEKPAQLQALAYTQGDEVHIGPGQEKHLQHELGHVAQQKAGLVQATGVIDGVPVNDDAGLEQGADDLYAKALQYSYEYSDLPKYKSTPDGMPVQRKNANNIDIGDFSEFIEDDTKKRAHGIWEGRGMPEAQTKEQQEADYFQAYSQTTDGGKKTLIKSALASTHSATHPETKKFKRAMSVFINDEGLIDLIWNKILAGIAEQNIHNDNAKLRTNTGFLRNLHSDPASGFIYTNDNDNIRNDNLNFKEVGDMVEKYLTVRNQNKALALWSGGYDLSPYATKRGFVTLEESEFGKVLDSLYLSDNWNLIGPLWNIISKNFVKKYITENGTEFHVFIRAYDPGSVLIRQEVDQIYTMFEDMDTPHIHWHCIVQDETTKDYAEITQQGEVDSVPDRDNSTDSESACLGLLIAFYEKQNDGNRAKKTMKDSFAKTLGMTFDEVMEHLAVEHYRVLVQKEAYSMWQRNGAIEAQTQEQCKDNYLAAEKSILPKLIKERIGIMSYFLWKEDGARSDQTEDEQLQYYYRAESDFNNAVEARKAVIINQHASKKEKLAQTKAYHILKDKGSPQQSEQERQSDYFTAMQIVEQEVNDYSQNDLHNSASLDVALGILT